MTHKQLILFETSSNHISVHLQPQTVFWWPCQFYLPPQSCTWASLTVSLIFISIVSIYFSIKQIISQFSIAEDLKDKHQNWCLSLWFLCKSYSSLFKMIFCFFWAFRLLFCLSFHLVFSFFIVWLLPYLFCSFILVSYCRHPWYRPVNTSCKWRYLVTDAVPPL